MALRVLRYAASVGPVSETLSAGMSRDRKTTCRACKRTVHIVPLDVQAGVVKSTEIVDPEVITVVGWPGGDIRMRVRRVHAEMCLTYQAENERRAMRQRIARSKKGR